MKANKLHFHVSWLIYASLEEAKELIKVLNAPYLTKSKNHLNILIKLLNQLSINYNCLIRSNITKESLIKLKDTYLKRCLFQSELGLALLKETSMDKSLIFAWNKLNKDLNFLLIRFTYLEKISN